MAARHSIETSEHGGVRYLHFGSPWIQGAMRVARPFALELEYTREMMAALLLHPDPEWPESVLLVGLGAGSLAKFLYRHRPRATLHAVEINPEVVTIAHSRFRLPAPDERFEIFTADAARWLPACPRRYDLILVDGFDPRARAGALERLPFYQSCQEHLTRQGLCVTNLFAGTRGYAGAVERLREAFRGRVLAFPSCDTGNAVAFAASGEKILWTLDELRTHALLLMQATRLNLQATLTRLEAAQTCPAGKLRL
ncbi:MAG: fused MFS/spermidine synthase [Rhodocyclaceae bacterium]|nr:fused MFS/spermidine synthase [Rhodocyclaceae bacterium]MBX3668404.1 fused MFS/spermidine synthase [Rhodocyclaceae bacterium]